MFYVVYVRAAFVLKGGPSRDVLVVFPPTSFTWGVLGPNHDSTCGFPRRWASHMLPALQVGSQVSVRFSRRVPKNGIFCTFDLFFLKLGCLCRQRRCGCMGLPPATPSRRAWKAFFGGVGGVGASAGVVRRCRCVCMGLPSTTPSRKLWKAFFGGAGHVGASAWAYTNHPF